jgi:FtsP/CotA-like multicopper oxidase with cupredoxin domain
MSAGYVSVRPGECYCYQFDIPANHPTGTYWYHIHRHGSVAVQAWSGMAGMLKMVGSFDNQLEKYGVTREENFVVW